MRRWVQHCVSRRTYYDHIESVPDSQQACYLMKQAPVLSLDPVLLSLGPGE